MFLRRRYTPETADFIPQTHRRQFKHIHGLAAVDVGLLRKIGDVAALQPLPLHRARVARQKPHHGFEQGGFPRAVRAEYRIHAAFFKRHVHVVHRRACLIAHGQVVQDDAHAATAHAYTPQITASNTAARSSLWASPVSNKEDFMAFATVVEKAGYDTV